MDDIDIKRLVAQADLPTIAAAHTEVVKRGSELYARCLNHEPDNTPSCSIYHKGDKWRFKCFSCDWAGDAADWVMQAEGLDTKAAYERLWGTQWTPKRPIRHEAAPRPERVCGKPPFGVELPIEKMALRFGERYVQPETARAFKDEDGELICYEARYPRGCDPKDPDTSPSRMWTWGRVAEDEPQWLCRVYTAPDKLRPLYGIDRVVENEQAQVVVCEGPKKADAAHELLVERGLVGISWSGGARAWHKHDWTPIQGRSVVIWPDADEPGIRAAQRLAEHLDGLRCKVKVIETNNTE